MLYLAGPMFGYDEKNFPAFRDAARQLRAHGHRVFSPHEHTLGRFLETPKTWDYFLRRDLIELLRCDSIALLDGWEASRGAQLEYTVASALGLTVYRYTKGELVSYVK